MIERGSGPITIKDLGCSGMLQSSSVLFDDRLTVLTTVTRNNKSRPVEEDRSNKEERLDSRHKSEIGVRSTG